MSQFICDTQTGCTVTVVVEPAPAKAEHVQDILDVFYLMLGVIVVVWGSRQIINLFSTDTEK